MVCKTGLKSDSIACEDIMSNFRIAAYQMNVSADLDANYIRIINGIERAAAGSADMLALPECALSGYPPLHYDSKDDIDVVRIAELNDEVRSVAKSNDIWVILGTILMSSEGLLNSALVISNEGEVVGRYDKLHLMPDDKKFFAPGTGTRVFNNGDITFGVTICYDARFPEPFRYLREQGAELIVNISNACGGDTWKAPVLEGTYRTRASENSCFLAAVNAAGPLQMATSRICDPWGLDLASANQDCEEMIFADIDTSDTINGYFHDRRTDQFHIEASFDN